MRQVLRVLLPIALVVTLVAACGDDGDEVEAGDAGAGTSTTQDPDTAVSSPPLTDDAPTDTTWARIEPTDDLVDPRVSAPDEIIPDPDDPNAVLVHFYGGVQECYGARATVVEQNADEVTIRLETGSQPDAGGTACIDIAEAQELQVALDARVGDRTLTAATA
jgi:hypothetical protein